MKIALVMERFDSQGGGLEQWAWQLALALTQRGHRLTVVAFQAAAELPASIDVRLLPWHHSRLVRADTVDSAVAEIDADVIHDLGVARTADILQPQMGCRLANYRRELRSLSITQRLLRLLPYHRHWLDELRQLEQEQYVRQASGLSMSKPEACGTLIAVSQMVANDLQEFYSVEPDRIRLIPNGVDAARFSLQMREPTRAQTNLADKTVFLFAAHNPRLKGLRPLLIAFAKAIAKRPDLRLVVLGKEPSRASLRFVWMEQLQHAVIFAGFVSDTAPWFAAADAFVLPTYYDACSLSVLEACACGLPVITTAHNGASELLTDGREGRIIQDANDVDALTLALLELAEPEVRANMGPHALALASRCTFDRNVDEVEKVYMEMAGRPNLRRRSA